MLKTRQWAQYGVTYAKLRSHPTVTYYLLAVLVSPRNGVLNKLIKIIWSVYHRPLLSPKEK